MRIMTEQMLGGFRGYLREEERSDSTIEKYLRDVRSFSAWNAGQEVTRESVSLWKEYLMKDHAPKTVNSMLAAVNAFFRSVGWLECRVKYLNMQQRVFRSESKELTREEYERLLSTARSVGRERLALLMEAVCATGIRVSEVRYITVEAARTGRTDISLKGKIRTILLPGKLCRKLLKYAKQRNIISGEIFLTRTGRSLSRKQIWAEMKALCILADVEPSKVFPHNLRHLFARVFYRSCKDLAQLADVLGHSSIETTRLYLIRTGSEHQKRLDHLGLVV